MLKKLRLKFICITMVIVTVLLCGIFGLILYTTSAGLIQTGIRNMEMDGKGPGAPRPDKGLRPLHFSIMQNPDGTLQIKGDLSDRFQNTDYQLFWDSALASGKRSGIMKEHALRFLIEPDGRSIRFEDVTGELAAMAALWRSCSIISILVWLVMLAVSIFLANWTIRPVEQAWKQQQQFVADASHELKTPLTVIMTNAELLESADYDEAAKAQSLRSILTMSKQMRHLVEGMLELARADAHSVHAHFEKIDLSALLGDAILPFDALFFEKELTLSAQITPGIWVHGNAEYLKQIVEILMDNAQKYSTSPGQVCLTLEAKGKHAVLKLETPGTPLSKEDRKQIFKRFYRIDQARTRTGSYGLGLSIAQQIVDAHKGKIWADTTENTNVFYVQLPMLSSYQE